MNPQLLAQALMQRGYGGLPPGATQPPDLAGTSAIPPPAVSPPAGMDGAAPPVGFPPQAGAPVPPPMPPQMPPQMSPQGPPMMPPDAGMPPPGMGAGPAGGPMGAQPAMPPGPPVPMMGGPGQMNGMGMMPLSQAQGMARRPF